MSRTHSCYFIKWLVLLASCEDLQAVISVNAVFLTHLYPHRTCVRSTTSCWCCDWLCVAFVWSGLRLFYPLWWRRDGVTCWQWRKSLPLLLEKKNSYLRPIWLIFKNTQQQQQFIKFKKKFTIFYIYAPVL